jgi:hypothetical protein
LYDADSGPVDGEEGWGGEVHQGEPDGGKIRARGWQIVGFELDSDLRWGWHGWTSVRNSG